jgi:uncharacterized membrane protein YfcA
MLVAATLGFGDALILIPLLSLMIDTRDAIVLSGFWGIILNFTNYIRNHNHVDKNYLKYVIPLGIPGVILGSFLIGIAPLAILSLFLGIFIIGFIGLKISGKIDGEPLHLFNNQKDSNTNTIVTAKTQSTISPLAISIGGFSYGFLGGLIGASGPINVMLLQATHHEKEAFISTFAATSISLTIIKLGIYIFTGLFPINLILVYILGIPTIFLASYFGHRLSQIIPRRTFQIFVLILLGVIAMRMIISFFI